MDDLSGTKELIFDTFIEMTSMLGYESVSMRDIAARVGIKVASIYNHFETKAKILEYAYNYYSNHIYDTRKPAEDMKKLIMTAKPDELVKSLLYTFVTDDQKKYVRMILTTKIIYMRLYQDPIANALFAESINNNAEYVTDILKYGISIGRIKDDFDIKTFADMLIGSIIIMGIKAFAGAAYEPGQLDEEKRILALLARLLSTAMK